MPRPVRCALLASLALVLPALAAPSAGAADVEVAVGDDRTLSPATVAIAPDDTVTWRWVGPDTDHRIVSSPAGQAESWDSGDERARRVGDTYAHLFDRSGSFTYICVVHPNDMRGTVNVSGLPAASFTATPADPFTGQSVAFDARASADPDGTIARYEWDLDGNGTFETDTATTPTTSRAYPTAGPLTVRLRVTDDRGNPAHATRAITVRSRVPVPSFTATPATAAKGQTVAFDASATTDPDGGTITRHEWDLDGDGAFETDTGATATASTSYARAGARTVALRVTDDTGLRATATRTVTVTNHAPAAALTAGDRAPLTGVPVTFDASASHDADGTVATYAWDLDGNGTFETAPSASPTITHAYARAGARTVRVRVTDDEGATADAAVSVTVGNRLPLAALAASSDGTTFTFSAAGSSDPEATALAYRWDLDGDGTFETSTGTVATASRTYASAGARTVRVRVVDADGGTDDAEVAIDVPEAAAAPSGSSPATPGPAPAAPEPTPAAPSVAAAPVLAAASRAPALIVRPARGRRTPRTGRVAVRVACAVACRVRVSGTIAVGGRRLRLRAVVRRLAAGRPATVTLRVTRSDRRRMRRARRATAVVTVVTVAPAGRAAQRLRIALRA